MTSSNDYQNCFCADPCHVISDRNRNRNRDHNRNHACDRNRDRDFLLESSGRR